MLELILALLLIGFTLWASLIVFNLVAAVGIVIIGGIIEGVKRLFS